MANCKNDFLEETKDKNVLCAEITYHSCFWDDECIKEATLPIGYSDVEMQNFLQAINYQYGSGYGCQEVFGTIWYADGAWSERGGYDGSEWWDYKSCPKIPDDLRGA